MPQSDQEYFKNVFAFFPTPSCLIKKSDFSIICLNNAFESGLGYHSNELVLPAAMQSVLSHSEDHSILQEFISNVTEVGSSRYVEIVLTGKVAINHSFTISGHLTVIDDSTVLLSGSLNINQIPIIKRALSIDETSQPVNEEFPLPFKNLVDLFKNAAVGVHCTSADGVVMWANDYFLNLMGYEAKEYIGQKVAKFTVPGDNPEYLVSVMSRIRQGETVNNVRTSMRAKDGSIKYLIADSGAYFHPDGTFSHTKTFIRDDIERLIEDITNKEIQQRLEAIAIEKDRFMRIMFHELRTPLNILSLGIQNLQEGNFSTTPHSATSLSSVSQKSVSVSELKHQVNKFMGVMDDLSFVMMFDSDNVVLPRPTVRTVQDDLSDIFQTLGISYTLDKFREQIGTNCRFKLSIAKELPNLIMYDKSLLRVFFNLLSNAMKFCSPGGEVEMSVSYQKGVKCNDDAARQDVLIVTIVNSMREKLDLVHVNKLFQKYLRLLPAQSQTPIRSENDSGKTDKSVKSTRTAEELAGSLVSSDGLGLGLYVSYNILQSLGGLLECSSTDNQACFWFTLPVTSASVSVATTPTASAAVIETDNHYIKLEDLWAHVTSSEVSSRHVIGLRQKVNNAQQTLMASVSANTLSVVKKGRILVVDDSPICRKVLIRALETNNYSTDFACDGQEAVQKMSVKPCSYSAVLMDLRMPIMDGITATKICKSMEHASRVPIIIVTAEMGEEIRSAAMEAKANCFLNKPILVAQLLTTLEEMIVTKKS